MSLRADLMMAGWDKDLEEAGWVAQKMKGKITFSKRGRKSMVVPQEKPLERAIRDLRVAEMLPIYFDYPNCPKIPMYVTCKKCGLEEIHVGRLRAGFMTGNVFVLLQRPPPGWSIEVGGDCRPLATGICPRCKGQL